MIHEISQLDIPDRQLLANDARPNIWTEIGEAQITHTIFGRAKVRIIRKNDNQHRIWWLTGIVAVALAVAAWQGLFTPQQPEPAQDEDLPPPVSAKQHVIAPVFPSANITPPETPPAAMKEPGAPAQAEIDKAAIIPKSAPQAAHALRHPEPDAAKPAMPQPKPLATQQKPIDAQSRPVAPQPRVAAKPQIAAPTPISAAKIPATTQPPARPIPPKPVGATAVPALTAGKPYPQSAASSPAAAIQLSTPLGKDDATTPVPAGDKQPALDSVQNK